MQKRRTWFRNGQQHSEVVDEGGSPEQHRRPKQGKQQRLRKRVKTKTLKQDTYANANQAPDDGLDAKSVSEVKSFSTTGINEDERKVLFRKSLHVLAKKYLAENKPGKKAIDGALNDPRSSKLPHSRSTPLRNNTMPEIKTVRNKSELPQLSFDTDDRETIMYRSASESDDDSSDDYSTDDDDDNDEDETFVTETTGSATFASEEDASTLLGADLATVSTRGTITEVESPRDLSSKIWFSWTKALMACTAPSVSCADPPDRDLLYSAYSYTMDQTIEEGDEDASDASDSSSEDGGNGKGDLRIEKSRSKFSVEVDDDKYHVNDYLNYQYSSNSERKVTAPSKKNSVGSPQSSSDRVPPSHAAFSSSTKSSSLVSQRLQQQQQRQDEALREQGRQAPPSPPSPPLVIPKPKTASSPLRKFPPLSPGLRDRFDTMNVAGTPTTLFVTAHKNDLKEDGMIPEEIVPDSSRRGLPPKQYAGHLHSSLSGDDSTISTRQSHYMPGSF